MSRDPEAIASCRQSLFLQHSEEFGHDLFIPQTRAGLGTHSGRSLLVRPRRLIRTRSPKCIINVHYLEHAREQRYVLSTQCVRVAATIRVLVMTSNDWKYKPQRSERTAYLLARGRMLLHDLPFGRGEIGSLL